MPKETFINLPLARKEVVIKAALNEFAQHTYERASLSRIVDNAGIAKGSMYQYFENKRALYLYIVDIVYDLKREYLWDVFEDSSDFFGTLIKYYQRSYLFAVEHPLYHQVATNFWESNDETLHQELAENKELRANDFIRLLKLAKENGQIKQDMCPEAAFFVYHSVGKELTDKFSILSVDQTEKHLQFIEDVLRVLAEGLKSGKEGEQQ